MRVEGADALLELGKRLKAAGRGDVVKELQKALREGAKPITPATRAEALRRLPAKGGLNRRVAKAPQRVTARIGNTSASVRVTVAGKKSGAYGADVGTVRHKTFGRLPWVDQKVEPGWFSETAEQKAPEVREKVIDTVADFAKGLARPLP